MALPVTDVNKVFDPNFIQQVAGVKADKFLNPSLPTKLKRAPLKAAGKTLETSFPEGGPKGGIAAGGVAGGIPLQGVVALTEAHTKLFDEVTKSKTANEDYSESFS